MKRMMMTMALVAGLTVSAAQAQTTATPVVTGELPLTISPQAWPIPFIVPAGDVTVVTGTVGRDQAIVTYPFAYRRPLRLKNDLHTFLHKIPAGSLGFDVGDFAGMVGIEHVMCFFREDQAQPYAVPECLRYLNKLGVKWATAMVSNNIPLVASNSDPVFGSPEVETDGVVIPHDFSFQLRFDGWSKKGARLHWLSEGKGTGHGLELPLNDDGSATIDAAYGTIRLTRDAADTSLVDVAFTRKPHAEKPAPPAAQPVSVDGVVYSPGH